MRPPKPAAVTLLFAACAQPPPEPLRAEVRSFAIELPVPVADAAPLFGPVREREWAPQWAPTFVQPAAPAQEEGAVFTTSDAHGESLWVLTDYDPAAGRIGYVMLQPGVVVAQLRIELRPTGDSACVATVTSRRTALSSAGNEAVDRFAQHFAQQGPHWHQAIAGSLARARPR
jgi:hypothetical protein